MGKHYCRKGGAPVGVMDVPPFADPGRVVENTDRMDREEPTYGRVRMLFRCCATVLVEFMTDPDDTACAGTYTRALPLDRVTRVPDGVAYSVPCVGAEWSATLPCGHVNGEGCDCDAIAVEAAQGDGPGDSVIMVSLSGREYPCSAAVADMIVADYATDPYNRNRYMVRHVWESAVYMVAVYLRCPATRAPRGRIVSFLMPLV